MTKFTVFGKEIVINKTGWVAIGLTFVVFPLVIAWIT